MGADRPFPPSAVMARSRSVVWEVLDGRAVLWDSDSGRALSLNSTATAVWRALDGTATVGEVVDELADAFGGDQVVIAGGVEELLRQLCDWGATSRAD